MAMSKDILQITEDIAQTFHIVRDLYDFDIIFVFSLVLKVFPFSLILKSYWTRLKLTH